jgi:hypothetical protein
MQYIKIHELQSYIFIYSNLFKIKYIKISLKNIYEKLILKYYYVTAFINKAVKKHCFLHIKYIKI